MSEIDAHAVKEQQRQDWARAAPGWRKNHDRLTQITAPVSRRLLELAGVARGHRVLDIACGTGEPALPAARVVGASGFVLATDMAPEMLAVGREKAQAQGIANIEFRLVDGEELDLEPGSFDAATCRWGIMFMPEPVRCLRQAHRALKPGGRIALSVWGPPERNPFIALPMVILRKHFQGPLPDPSAPGGAFSFADRERLAATLGEAGFRDVQVEDLELSMAVFDSGQEFWQYTREMAAPIAALVAQLPAETQRTVGEEVAHAAEGPEGKVSLRGYPLLASARK